MQMWRDMLLEGSRDCDPEDNIISEKLDYNDLLYMSRVAAATR